ncbi:TerD family protein [archaeon]|nr:TerD family protein [archaeon]
MSNQKSINVFDVVFSKQHNMFIGAFSEKANSGDKFGSNKKLALTLQVNIESYGFSFSKQALISMSNLSEDQLTNLWGKLSTQAKQVVGASKIFKPMYPNFPKQVLDASDEELMTNALMHYLGDWIGLRVLPKYKEEVRLPLVDKVKPKIIGVAFEHDVEELFTNLISANTSLSVTDKNTVSVLFEYLKEKGVVASFIEKATIPQKENLAYLGGLVLKSELNFNTLMANKFDTPTDVLRLNAAIFDGDVSLSVPTKIGKMSRPMRKAIMATLENQLSKTNDVEQLVENFFTYKEMWVRLGHALHPGEHAKKFPKVFSVFENIRSNNKPITFNSKVQSFIEKSDVVSAVNLLVQRPGVFARQLNQLLSLAVGSVEKIDLIVSSFEKSSMKVATPVLLQLHSHFLHQDEKEVRAFMPKGGLSKLFVVDNNNNAISKEIAMKITNVCEKTLVSRFEKFEKLGKVFVDPKLKLQNVPFAQRSASKALASVARGSRFDVEEKDKSTIRLFLWWNENGINKEGEEYGIGRVDVDLSCVLMDKNYKEIETCSYYNLRSGKEGAFAHSGDITSAPNGACEFIDINLDKLDSNVRYVVMTVNAFTNQKYCDMPECFAGWMMREHPQSGEIFDARTVANKVDLTSDSTQMMPAIFDTKTKQFIWGDLAVKVGYGVNNVQNNLSSIGYNVKAITNLIKPNLYDLFMLHAKARGELVSSKKEADTVFSLNEGVTPYMFDRISSEFMADENNSVIIAPEVKIKKHLV